MSRAKPGFTLVEVLVVCAVLAALLAAGGAVTCVARNKARMAIEVNASRNLIAGYLGHAFENNGAVLAGYETDPEATNLHGELLHFPMNARYPWRLAPHLPKVEGVLLVNGNEAALKTSDSDYRVSAQPNLGLNATLVGGHFGTSSPLRPSEKIQAAFGKFLLTHTHEAPSAEGLLVFASARSGPGQVGYYEVRPPNLTRPVWDSGAYTEDATASDFGFVDFRWDGKAVCAMLGGNIELLDEVRMRDMRRWSIQAQAEDDPKFLIRRR